MHQFMTRDGARNQKDQAIKLIKATNAFIARVCKYFSCVEIMQALVNNNVEFVLQYDLQFLDTLIPYIS